MRDKNNKIKIALMGIGKIALDQHIPTIDKSDDFELVATISKSHPINNIPNFNSISELKSAIPEISAIAICTPPQVRCDYTIEALRHGLHTMMEKPPTSTICEFDEILEFHKDTDLTLFTAWHSRYAAKVENAALWLEKNPIEKVKITWRESALKWHPGQHWLWQPGGMGIFDPAINAFSIITKLLGKNIRVLSAKFQTPSNQFAPIAADIEMKLGNVPISANLDFREADKEIWEIEFNGKNGNVMKLARGGAAISVDNGDFETSPDIEYEQAYNEFAQLIKSGNSNADNSPQRIAADSFMLAKNQIVEEFNP